MSGTYDPIAYTYDADHHCPSCAFERFGKDENGFVPENAEDSEGNPVGSICPWDVWWQENDGPETLVCGDCHEVIDISPPSDAWVTRCRDAYVECAVWADSPRDEDGDEIESDGLEDVTLTELESDVDEFLRDDETLSLLVGMDAAQVGHDFWLTRNRHGAGFWDRGLSKRGERLTEISHAYGSRDLYVGDDGLVYVQ